MFPFRVSATVDHIAVWFLVVVVGGGSGGTAWVAGPWPLIFLCAIMSASDVLSAVFCVGRICISNLFMGWFHGAPSVPEVGLLVSKGVTEVCPKMVSSPLLCLGSH